MRPILCAAVATAIALLHIPTAYSLSCPPCALSVCETPKCCESGSFVKVRIMFTDFHEQENKFNSLQDSCGCCDVCAKDVEARCGGPWNTAGVCKYEHSCYRSCDECTTISGQKCIFPFTYKVSV